MDTPLISIIIPVYNTEPYLRQCLDSVCGQTYGNLEIICVDDGSTDGSGAIVDEYAARDSRVVAVHQQNQGQARARNVGIAMARGEYVTGLDSDDYLAPQAYERVVANFPPECDIMLLETTVVGDADKDLKEENQKYYSLKYSGVQNVELEQAKKTDASFWDKVIRRSLLEKYELRFPESYIFEDAGFYFCLMGVAKRAYYLKERLHYYRIRQGSTMFSAYEKTARALDHLRIMEDICEFYDRHGLRSSKGALLGYAFQYCCGFTEYHCSESLRDEVQQLECEMARKAGLLHYGMSHLPAVLKLRDMALPAWERLFHRCNNHQDKFGPLGFPLFSVVHEETEDVFRFLKFELKRKAVTRRPLE